LRILGLTEMALVGPVKAIGKWYGAQVKGIRDFEERCFEERR
jgi:hypothetical protein